MSGFSCHTRIISGLGALSHLESLHYQRVFVVTDSFFSKNGTAKQIASKIPKAQVCIFDRVIPDPDLNLVAQGVAEALDFQPDCIIALGGGSPMDCAKAIRFFSELPIKLIAIPTTSGTGSEVTTFSIITKQDVKLPLVDDALAPDLAILDADLLQNLPKSLIADAGFDVLSHCVEAIAATNATTMSDAMAANAFQIVYHNLISSWNGETSVRMSLHEAACMAGIAFNNAGLGVCHAVSHALGGQFHITHGKLNAILLPSVITLNAAFSAEKYSLIAARAGISGATNRIRIRNLSAGMVRLRNVLQLPASLQEVGISHESLHGALDDVIKAALNDRCLQTNPVCCSAEMIRSLILAVEA